MARKHASPSVYFDFDERLPPGENGNVRKVAFHGCFAECTSCGGIKPLAEFGVLYDKKTHTIRNQPQCSACRSKRD